MCPLWCGALLESVVRRGGSDEWESEEEEENADRSDLADVVVVRVVRGANASPKISAPRRRLVSRRAGGRPSRHRPSDGRRRRRRAYRAPLFPPVAAESQWQIQLPFWTTERFSQREARTNVQGALKICLTRLSKSKVRRCIKSNQS